MKKLILWYCIVGSLTILASDNQPTIITNLAALPENVRILLQIPGAVMHFGNLEYENNGGIITCRNVPNDIVVVTHRNGRIERTTIPTLSHLPNVSSTRNQTHQATTEATLQARLEANRRQITQTEQKVKELEEAEVTRQEFSRSNFLLFEATRQELLRRKAELERHLILIQETIEHSRQLNSTATKK